MQSNCYNFLICVVVLFINILLIQIKRTDASCAQTQCNVSQCVNPSNCFHGITDDECDCCKVCLRRVGETCGKQIGRCVKGLQCLNNELFDPVVTNLVIIDKEIGICGIFNCTGVTCNNGSGVSHITDSIKCHNDSYKLSNSESNSCCALSCACLPGICNTSRNRCPHNKIAHIIRPGNWTPGSCCDLIECIDAPTHCFHNKNKYLNGDKWKADKCTTCECRDGLTFCHKKQCNVIKSCNAMVVMNDECCPTCQGCFSSNGMFYNNTQKWFEDDCTHCECNNGEKSCRVEMCQPVSCDKTVSIAGHCCPICQTNACDLHCPQGFQKDFFGNDICECQTASYDINTVIDDSLNRLEDKVCISFNGTIYESGHYWHDGCRECICSNGKTMCTKPECPPIKCFNSIIIENNCCPICSDNEPNNSKTVQNNGIIESSHLNSHLFITAIILTLIITILLLGIFILLAIVIAKKTTYAKDITTESNRIIRHKENAIIQYWPNNRRSIKIPKLHSQENQLLSIHVANKSTNVLKETSESMDHLSSLQDELLTRQYSCPDKYT